MNAATWISLVIAAVAVVSAIGSVLFLGVRIGTLIGTVQGSLKAGDADRARIWQELGRNNGRIDRHVEIYHGSNRDRR